ncbi:hypothetical protein XU18_5220 [Perkinsela sp. CCAP 1560/4]|nr:hypothetical protein XU18_5220 [Perkinsela sp. CCAP 1560/4]|eukprot:KNH00543.1 hypothetical protein XU18_5220 [Perkinsela sp. CCAP 1560/4]
MRQFHSHQRSSFRSASAYHRAMRCTNFYRTLFNLCKSSPLGASASVANSGQAFIRKGPSSSSPQKNLTRAFQSAMRSSLSLENIIANKKCTLQGSNKGDASASEWPNPTKATRKLMSHGALSAIIFGASVSSSPGVSGSAGLCSASCGLSNAFALSLLIQSGGSSAFIKALFHECGAAALPLETMMRTCTTAGIVTVDTSVR